MQLFDFGTMCVSRHWRFIFNLKEHLIIYLRLVKLTGDGQLVFGKYIVR